MSSSIYDLDPAEALKFNALQSEGKQLAIEMKFKEALEKFELAKQICPSERVLRRIVKLQECLKHYYGEDPNRGSNSSLSDDVFSKTEQKNLQSKNSVSRDPSFIPKVLSSIQNVPSRFSNTEEMSPHSQSQFRELRKKAKELCYEGRYEEAIQYFLKALKIFDCPKVKRYIEEIKMVMSNNGQNVEENDNLSDMVKPSCLPRVSNRMDTAMELETPVPRDSVHSDVVKTEIESTDNLNHMETKHDVTSGDSVSEKSDYDEKLAKVKVLYYEAREFAAEGKLKEALKLLKKANAVHETARVLKQIKKIEDLLSEEPEGDEMINITSDFKIFHEIYDKLYPYQREGIAWMWQLYKKGKGGVLGDDMGLGKTFQAIAFMSGMIDADLIKHVLIIMPVSLIPNWQKEFKKWCPGISVNDFHGGTKKERERNLLKIQKRGHVLLTSYGMLVNNLNSLTHMEDKEFIWDYVILDEGHKIKNPTKTTKAVHDIPAKNRLVLTGTPIQNNLRELWSLYDFVQQGTLLGSLKTFKMRYENPITRAREKDATAGEKRLGTEMAENLKSLIKPYFLRRTKDEIWGSNNEKNELDELENQMGQITISKLNARKNDLILWTFMSEPQIDIYKSFLHSNAVKAILVSKRSPLVELTTLKKICDHPRLLTKRACMQLGLNGELLDEDLLRELDDESSQSSTIDNVSDETLLQESGKLKLVIKLLENLRETGHRTLVFSLSRKILDMIHRILVNRKWKVMRVDGTVSKIEERERRIQKFQRDPSYPVFLLTTQVGGVGITLTAADRVIIYDPSWNPATDAQAVDRVYRIGQQKNVVVYRIITCGTVEEKIYRRQIFKDSITRQATGIADPYRYFSKQELRELFSIGDPYHSATQVQLSEMHSSERQTSEELKTHITFLQQLNIFGISDHDLMFSQNKQDHTEDNDECAVSEDYIKKQVATAHQLIQNEASVVAEGMRLAGLFTRPYQEMIPLPKKATAKDGYKPPVLPEVVDLTENAQDYRMNWKVKKDMFSQSDFIDLTSEKSLDKNLTETAGAVSSLTKDEQILLEVGRIFSACNTRNSPVIPPHEDTSEVESISNSNLSTKELVKRLSSKLELPIKSEISLEGQNNTSRASIEHNELIPCDNDTKVHLQPMSVLSIEELARKLSCKLEPPITSEISLAGQDDTSRLSMEYNELIPCDNDTKVHHRPVSVEDSVVQKQEPTESARGSENYSSPNLVTQKQDVLCTSNFVPDIQEKFQHNLTRLMTAEDLDDLSFDEMSNIPKTPRKSCARKSTILISESDSSQEGSCPPSLDTTANLVDESVDRDLDSSNNASLSFVANSAQNTPITEINTKLLSQAETPRKSIKELLSESTPVNYNPDSVWRKQEGSVRRITPLKVNRSFTPMDSSFSQALAASPILALPFSPVKVSNNSRQSFSKAKIDNTSFDDSPIIKWRKKAKPNTLDSDSEDENVSPVNFMMINEAEEIDKESEKSFDAKSSINNRKSPLESESEDENISKMDSVLDTTAEIGNESVELRSKHSGDSFSAKQRNAEENDFRADDSNDEESDYIEEFSGSDESGSIFSQD